MVLNDLRSQIAIKTGALAIKTRSMLLPERPFRALRVGELTVSAPIGCDA